MKNIELKAKCNDLENLKEKVLNSGGRFEVTMNHIDTYFNLPKGRLKLREVENAKAYIIFYERADTAESKESNYYTSNVDDPTALKDVLTRAYGVKVIVDKIRELYFIKNTRIHLDTVKDLGTFMELETVIKDQTEAEAQIEHQEVINSLGIEQKDLLKGSYSDLLVT